MRAWCCGQLSLMSQPACHCLCARTLHSCHCAQAVEGSSALQTRVHVCRMAPAALRSSLLKATTANAPADQPADLPRHDVADPHSGQPASGVAHSARVPLPLPPVDKACKRVAELLQLQRATHGPPKQRNLLEAAGDDALESAGAPDLDMLVLHVRAQDVAQVSQGALVLASQ